MNTDIQFEIDNVELILQRRGLDVGGKAQKMLDSEILRICSPYIPWLDGILTKSGKLHTKIGSGEIIWKTPYARKQYYTNKGVKSPPRGSYWFGRAWNANGVDTIKKIAAFVGGKAA